MRSLRVCFAFLACIFLFNVVQVDVPIAKIDGWELFTSGRVNAFFSYGQGDSNPVPLVMGENITPGGGLDTSYDNIPVIGPDGMALPVQGTFKSMRLRSGFVPNVLGLGLRRPLNESTTLKIYATF